MKLFENTEVVVVVVVVVVVIVIVNVKWTCDL